MVIRGLLESGNGWTGFTSRWPDYRGLSAVRPVWKAARSGSGHRSENYI